MLITALERKIPEDDDEYHVPCFQRVYGNMYGIKQKLQFLRRDGIFSTDG